MLIFYLYLCHNSGKLAKVPYLQAFFSLRSYSSLIQSHVVAQNFWLSLAHQDISVPPYQTP